MAELSLISDIMVIMELFDYSPQNALIARK